MDVKIFISLYTILTVIFVKYVTVASRKHIPRIHVCNVQFYRVVNLKVKRKYEFRVKAVNNASLEGGWSEISEHIAATPRPSK